MAVTAQAEPAGVPLRGFFGGVFKSVVHPGTTRLSHDMGTDAMAREDNSEGQDQLDRACNDERRQLDAAAAAHSLGRLCS